MDLLLGVRLRLGVSSCLLGEAVRYDGGHKRDHWVADRFGPMVDWVRVCPEEEAGLGTPREPIQLEAAHGGVRVRGVRTGSDRTDTLDDFARQRLDALDLPSLDGYVFKARSPSCGVTDVPVHDAEQRSRAIDRARGRFVAALLQREPHLPVCDEDDVQVPERRRHFLERAQSRARWRALLGVLPPEEEERTRALRHFFERHELLLLCREQSAPGVDGCGCDAGALVAVGREFAARMSRIPTVAGHVAALGALHDRLEDAVVHERVGLAMLIREVERERVDVEVPRQLARGIARRLGAAGLLDQHYLDPVMASPS